MTFATKYKIIAICAHLWIWQSLNGFILSPKLAFMTIRANIMHTYMYVLRCDVKLRENNSFQFAVSQDLIKVPL